MHTRDKLVVFWYLSYFSFWEENNILMSNSFFDNYSNMLALLENRKSMVPITFGAK